MRTERFRMLQPRSEVTDRRSKALGTCWGRSFSRQIVTIVEMRICIIICTQNPMRMHNKRESITLWG